MATNKKINIQVGLISADVEKGLKKLSSQLRQMGDELQRVGTAMSVGLTVPIIAAGKASFDSARKLDSFIQRLNVLEGGAKAGAEALSDLVDLAKLPGLTLESSVEGYNRLRALNFAAEESKTILLETANAVSLYGGTVDQVNGVLLAFGQIIGKNQVQQEELNQLAERFPSIRSILEEEFGGVTGKEITKQLQEQGQSAQDFVRRVINAFAELERSPITLDVAFQTLTDQINVFLGSIGRTIAEALNLQDVMFAIGEALTLVTEWFENLTDEQKKSVVQWGLIVAAIGPAIGIIGVIISSVGGMITVFTTLAGFLSVPVVAAIGAAVAAFVVLAEMGVTVNDIITVVGDTIQALVALFTFLGKTIVGTAVAGLRAFVAFASGNFVRGSLIVEEMFTNIGDAANGLADTMLDIFGGKGWGAQAVKGFTSVMDRINSSMGDSEKVYEAIRKRFQGVLDLTGGDIRGPGGDEQAARDAREFVAAFDNLPTVQLFDPGTASELELIANQMAELADITKDLTLANEANALIYEDVNNGLVGARENLRELTNFEQQHKAALQEKTAAEEARLEQLKQQNVLLSASGKYLVDIETIAGNAFKQLSDGLSEGADSFKEFGQAVAQTTKKVVQSFIQATLAAYALSIVQTLSLTGFGAILIPGLITAGLSLLGGILNTAINAVVPFAEGGIVRGPTVGLVGEAGPEAIIPLEKLDKLVGGAVQLTGEFTVRGTDLKLVLDRVTQSQKRVI